METAHKPFIDIFRQAWAWKRFEDLSSLQEQNIDMANISYQEQHDCFKLLFETERDYYFFANNIPVIEKSGLILTPELKADMLKLVAQDGAYQSNLESMYYLLRNSPQENQAIMDSLNTKQNLTVDETKVVLEQIDSMLDNLKLKRGGIWDNIRNMMAEYPVHRSGSDTTEAIIARIENLSLLRKDFKDYLKTMEHKENKPSFLSIANLSERIIKHISPQGCQEQLTEKAHNKPAG